jgi:hypothetical protein
MKTIPFTIASLLVSVCWITAEGPAEVLTSKEATRNQDAVVGSWRWDSGSVFFLHADGTATEGYRGGTWVCLSPEGSPRKYQVNWENSKFVDTFSLAQNGGELAGQNQNKLKLHATRVAKDEVVKNPDPVVGRWRWGTSGSIFSLHTDGTASEGSDRRGTWTCLSPDGVPRLYQINWQNSKFLDTLSLVKDGAELSGQNQDHLKLQATRVPL